MIRKILGEEYKNVSGQTYGKVVGKPTQPDFKQYVTSRALDYMFKEYSFAKRIIMLC